MLITKDYKDLIQSIQTKGITSIAIDGFHGTGKTSLSKSISDDSWNVIHFDDYSYQSTLNPPQYRLKLNLIRKILKKSQLFVLEGICMIDKLNSLKIRPDLYIYLLRISPYGMIREDIFLENTTITKSGTLADTINSYHIKNNMVEDISNLNLKFAENISKHQALFEVID